jgi:hypothetical protein
MSTWIARERSSRQQISRHDFISARDVVAWLGAVQAQDPAGARWAIGVRLPPGSVSEASIEKDLDDGRIVRIHAMRFTWQLVAPEDVRWMLALLAPRILARGARRFAELGLDAKTIARSNGALAKALRGGAQLTRAELAKVLIGARVSPEGQRLSHLLGCAELEGVIANGARRGNQPTWALLDDRVPQTKPKNRDDALRELARRYFQSRAPATAADFTWWSGLASAEARVAMEAAKLDGGRRRLPDPGTHLLPPFDEYLVGYRDRTAVLAAEHVTRLNAGGGLLAPAIVSAGRIVGTWRRVLGRSTVHVEHAPFAKVTAADRRTIGEATKQYARFLGKTLAD